MSLHFHSEVCFCFARKSHDPAICNIYNEDETAKGHVFGKNSSIIIINKLECHFFKNYALLTVDNNEKALRDTFMD